MSPRPTTGPQPSPPTSRRTTKRRRPAGCTTSPSISRSRSQHSEARLIEQFETAAERLTGKVGDLIVVDDEDERLVLESSGNFRAEVVPEDTDGEWRTLSSAEEIVEFYDPTDIFGDLADALAEAFPAVAPEDELEAADEEVEEAETEAESESEVADEGEADADGAEGRPTA